MLRSPTRVAALVALASLSLSLASAGRPTTPAAPPLDLDRGAAGLGLALRRVGTSARVLYVTAHPDDEHNGVLVRLSRGLGVRTALVSLTRGEGGQNAIGPELFEALGVLRTGELGAMHRFDAVEQYFGRAYEFGYSFSAEETLERWGHEDSLSDVVRVYRAFRPDVVLTLPSHGTGGGQHHQATGRLALEAFTAAADPARFPEQLEEGLRPWQPLKIYAAGVGGGEADLPRGRVVRVPTGVFDPLLGMTWQQLGSRARAMHRCQMIGQLTADPGPADGAYVLLDGAAGPGETDVLDGVDTTLGGLVRFAPALAARVAAAQERSLAARNSFQASAPEASVPALVSALQGIGALEAELGALVASPAARAEVAERLAEESADIEDALVHAQALTLEARADDGLVVPGQVLQVTVSAWNAGAREVALEDVALEAPPGWKVAVPAAAAGTVAPGGKCSARFAVTVSASAPASRPYWRRMPDRDRNAVAPAIDPTLPWAPPELVARLRLRIAGAGLIRRVPVVFRYEGPFVGGEKRHVVQVVPAVDLRTAPEVAALPLARRRQSLELRVFARANAPGPTSAQLRLELPRGWTARPAQATVAFRRAGEQSAVRFELVPPERPTPGEVRVSAVGTSAGREHRERVQEVEYEHVERRQLVRPAQTRIVCLDVKTSPGASVGYVSGSGDELAEAISGLGVPVAPLGPDELALGDLSRFSTIVTGIRAYETRPDLRSSHARLMRWVEQGGHLVVQYNRAPFNAATGTQAAGASASPFAPYPARVGPERVSDESAPVRVLAPRHPLLTTPNAIGGRDWSGWVQERGIQLLDTRDARYLELLAATDPFPYNPGEKRGLLVDAAVGRGTWTYVGLALFRQVPAGVPGAWRLLANLVSRPRPRVPEADVRR